MKKLNVLSSLIFGTFSFAQISKSDQDSITNLKQTAEINSNLKASTQQVYNQNNGFKKEINYFSKAPFGENTIGNYNFQQEKLKMTFVESFVNMLLNSRNK